ncbi:MAG: hypothetical protein Q9M19_07410 [Mariprofundaceae bacterium]|nr:hypothetical protein [Mariprofundaceae bacterium]
MNTQLINPVRYGLMLGIFALLAGASWAAYMATHHEQLHGAFETQQGEIQQKHTQKMMQGMAMDEMDMGEHAHAANASADHHQQPKTGHAHAGNGHEAGAQHSHTGSLANDAMQRLLRGHIHAMGLGILSCVLLLIVALTTLKDCWKKVFGFTFGLGAVLYPPAWVIMGFRTVELGPEAAEASIMWLFGPAVGLLLGSMVALLFVLLIEQLGWHKTWLARFFVQHPA